MSLGNHERRMLRVMLSDASRTWNLPDLLEATGWSDQVHIAEQEPVWPRRGC